MSLSEKLSRVAAKVGFASFDNKNDFHGYQYASAASIIRMVNKALSEEGIALGTQSELLQYIPEGKGARALVKLTVRFTSGDEVVEAQGVGEGKDSGDKACAKANTSAYKYCLAHAFCMAWGAEDPEADSKTDAGAAKPKGKPAAKVAPKKLADPVRSADEFAAAIGAATEKTIEAIVTDLKKQRSALGADFKKLRQAVIDRRAALAKGDSK